MPIIPGPMLTPGLDWIPNTECCAAWDTYSDGQKAYATMMSAGIMWALTGRRFGLESFTERPCNPSGLLPVYQTYPVTVFNPWGGDDAQLYSPAYIYNGVWYNSACSGMQCCNQGCAVMLPQFPVYAVSSVVIDGVALDPTKYRVDDDKFLIRQDGNCWPRCQNFSLPDGQVGTWDVSYLKGQPVPAPLLAAQGALACQIAASCGGQACALPQRMQSLTRQGVSVQFVQVTNFLDRGLTNIPEVDAAVARYNPNRLMQAPEVRSLDLPPVRRTTWTV